MDRVSVARERLSKVSAELRSPAVDLPCIQCRYYELVCTHPAVSEVRANPVTGTVKQKGMDPAMARAEDGPCGPEGALFDGRSLPATVLVSMLSTSAGRWVLGIGTLVVGALLFG